MFDYAAQLDALRRALWILPAAAALGHHVASGGIARAQVETELWAAAPRLGLAQDGEAWHQVQSGLADGETEPYVLSERPLNGSSPVTAMYSVAPRA